jgi:hypothetical protein
MRRFLFAALLAGAALLPAWAQSNGFIDSVIGSKAINASEAAYLILVASENLGDDDDAARAFAMLEQLKWVPDGLKADSPINFGQFCYMLMRAFGIKGGLWYQLFPGPRYAYRELRYQVVVQGATDPMMPVSGAAAMRLIGRVFDVKGAK